MTKKKTLLIDGDILIYQAASASEVACDWGDDFWTLHADEQEGRSRLLSLITDILDQANADEYKFFISSKDNFRKDVWPEYKANRKDQRKPLILPALRKFASEELDAICLPNIEADDALGVYSVNGVIVSKDKDLLTVPGEHWSPDKGYFEIDEDTANEFWLTQALTGDATDGYKGCPGIGPKKAEAILQKHNTFEDKWEAVVATYEKANLSVFEAYTNAVLARILRPGEYDISTGEVTLWDPNKI
jgi:DNA polymerase-1